MNYCIERSLLAKLSLSLSGVAESDNSIQAGRFSYYSFHLTKFDPYTREPHLAI